MINKYIQFLESHSLDSTLNWLLELDGTIYTLRWTRGEGWFLMLDGNVKRLASVYELETLGFDLAEVQDYLESSCMHETMFAALVLEKGKDLFGAKLIDSCIDVLKTHKDPPKLKLIKT